ncbi:MAG: PQQ-binding-like beta-propeller repeat protein, partial [Thermoplasmatales archaeon]|nr:PQQ-binding-like beta-propeller repeat protein [Thermoplasmatales archaeon]
DWITDIKITDSSLLKQNGVWAFFGNPHKMLNITNLDSNVETIRQVPPQGWVRFFGVPEKENFTLMQEGTNYSGEAEILWSYDTGNNVNDFSSSGVVDEEILYVTTSHGELYSIDAENGEKKWSTYVGEKPTTPVVRNDLLFVGHSEGLSVFDTDGNSKWDVSTLDVVSRPVIADDNVIFGDNIGNVYALSPSDGMEQWRLNFSDEIYVSPAYSDIVYIASGKSCYAVSLDDHVILWNFTSSGMITSPPTMKNGIVYFSSWDNHIYALNPSDGELIWNYEAGWGFDTTPAVYNGLVFAASADNNVYALDADNGSLSWLFSCNAAIHSSPVVFGEYVFFGSDDGRLYAVHTSTGESAWFFSPEYSIDNDVYNFITTPFVSDPAIGDGVLYVGLNGT